MVHDSIGNQIQDASEGVTGIDWNVYGKIREISHCAHDVVPASKIKYIYDAQGNRIGEVTEHYNGPATNYTWYVRDPPFLAQA